MGLLNKVIINSLGLLVLIFGLASFIGGVWLAILGEWKLIGIGILFLIASPWILSILMIPALISGLGGSYFYEKRKLNFLGYVLIFVSQFYKNVLIVITCVFSFLISLSFCTGNNSNIPYLLWSWGIALVPWQFLASKEPDNDYSAIIVFSASVLYSLFLISNFIIPSHILEVAVILGVIQLILVPILGMYIIKQTEK